MENLKEQRKLMYNIIVRMPTVLAKNDPIDLSFLSYLHPSFISDRSNMTNQNKIEGSEFPEFTDVKIFLDSLLISYQSNRSIDVEVKRRPMTCTPFRRDFINGESQTSMRILIELDFLQ